MANNYGKLAYGAISMIVARMNPPAPFLMKDMVKSHLWHLNKAEKQQRCELVSNQNYLIL
jgi:hypothetical protein